MKFYTLYLNGCAVNEFTCFADALRELAKLGYTIKYKGGDWWLIEAGCDDTLIEFK